MNKEPEEVLREAIGHYFENLRQTVTEILRLYAGKAALSGEHDALAGYLQHNGQLRHDLKVLMQHLQELNEFDAEQSKGINYDRPTQ